MGAFDGKVAFVTGAARGQGRAHALRLAREGADLILVDILKSIETVDYAGPGAEDLDETSRLIKDLGRRVVATRADVRNFDELKAAVDDGVAQLGRLDVVVANAGIMAHARPSWEFSDLEWQTTLDINLTGVWHTTKAAIPHMIELGNGGAMVLTSSVAGVKAYQTYSNYVAAKHGVLGLMKTLAQELGVHNIRVNAILPSTVNTAMIQFPEFWKVMRPDLENPTIDDAAVTYKQMVVLDTPWIEPDDVAAAVCWLCSDEARYVTGMELRVDAGFFIK